MNTINLTQKERLLLEDQKSHEEMCIQKYNNYANQTSDPQLQQLFKTNASQEQQHLNSINQLLGGQVPQFQGGQQGSQQTSGMGGQAGQSIGQNQQMTQGQSNMQQSNMPNQNDKTLCTDLLMTEKYVSDTYNTAIFEFTDHNVRQVLNHIQKEEQEHGEGIFNYMQSHGMYNVQQ